MPKPGVTVLRDEDFLQEGEVVVEVPNLEEAKKAFTLVALLRKAALDRIGTEMDNADVTAVEFRIEGAQVIANVKQASVDECDDSEDEDEDDADDEK